MAHAENQRNVDDGTGYVKIFALKAFTNPVYRPEEHVFNQTTGKYCGGSDTKK